MKRFLLVCSVLVLLILSACSTLETSTSFNNQRIDEAGTEQAIAMINADNFGYYLFNCVPLFAGSNDNVGDWVAFKDTVNIDGVTDMATKKAKELGASKLVNVVSAPNETCQLALFTFGVFWYKDMQVSGIAVK